MNDIVWLNGTPVLSIDARIDPADRGFTLGDGIFETIRAAHGVPLHWARHFARLSNGAAVLGIPLPYCETTLSTAMHDLLRANTLDEAAIRLTLTRGPAPRGVPPPADPRPTLLIAASSLPPTLPPAHVIVAQSVRRNEFSPLSRTKSINYLDNILARREAEAAGADDALLLNSRGDLAEASAANVFLVLDGRWITPRIEDGALPGIARGLLLEGGRVTETSIAQACFGRVEAGFLVNSLGRRILHSINGRLLDQTIPQC